MSETLLKRVAAGEADALAECIDRYGGLVWSLARRLSASEAEAEDGVQEAFIALWENAARFDESTSGEATFVAMIARRRLIDRRRKHETYQRMKSNVSLTEPGFAGEADPNVTADEVARAKQAMEQLTAEQQGVLKLAIHHGLTHEQIAEHTNLPLGTVKTHVRRGLLTLREQLEVGAAGQAIGTSS